MSLRKVLVIGAGGNVGKATIEALLAEPGRFEVTGLTRLDSPAKLSPTVKHLRTDYSHESLVSAFHAQDAVISTISAGGLVEQVGAVDAAMEAGVKVFLPSEYGVDTSVSAAPDVIPTLKTKIKVLDYLKSKQDKISWVAIIAGSMFDWSLKIPGFGGFDLNARTAKVFDGGDVAYEATTLPQVGRTIAATLENIELTRNKYVYVNSFTTSQNQVLESLEKATGEKFQVTTGSSEELYQKGRSAFEGGSFHGRLDMIAAAFYQKGASLKLANYSASRGLWNERLGLAEESLTEVIQAIVAHQQQ